MDEHTQPILDFYLLIPYYNNLSGLLRSLESVHYDHEQYAILIVDDGSRQPLQEEELAAVMPSSVSVRILRLPVNKGITKALNTGLEWLAQQNDHRYVARLDCGDLCAPERFNRQVAYLNAHPAIDLVGSWCVFKNFSTGHSYRYITPTEHKEIFRSMHFRNIFIHPTVMWRAAVTERAGIYPENYPHAEDYGFFYEIINRGQGAVLPENLVTCEINPNGLSLSFRKEQLRSRMQVVKDYGKNRLFSLIGVLKLRILMVIPYKTILGIKRMTYGIKRMSVN